MIQNMTMKSTVALLASTSMAEVLTISSLDECKACYGIDTAPGFL